MDGDSADWDVCLQNTLSIIRLIARRYTTTVTDATNLHPFDAVAGRQSKIDSILLPKYTMTFGVSRIPTRFTGYASQSCKAPTRTDQIYEIVVDADHAGDRVIFQEPEAVSHERLCRYHLYMRTRRLLLALAMGRALWTKREDFLLWVGAVGYSTSIPVSHIRVYITPFDDLHPTF